MLRFHFRYKVIRDNFSRISSPMRIPAYNISASTAAIPMPIDVARVLLRCWAYTPSNIAQLANTFSARRRDSDADYTRLGWRGIMMMLPIAPFNFRPPPTSRSDDGAFAGAGRRNLQSSRSSATPRIEDRGSSRKAAATACGARKRGESRLFLRLLCRHSIRPSRRLPRSLRCVP